MSLSAVAACGTSTSSPHTTSGGGGAGRGGSGTSSSTDVSLGGNFGHGGSPPTAGTCSADLQSIIDASGNTLSSCPADQGCAGGACVPACSAAALSKGSIGCDFYAPDPPFYLNNAAGSYYSGACYAVFVANTWTRPAQISVTRAGQTFDLTQFGRIPSGILPNITYDPVPATGVPPNQVAVLFLSHTPVDPHPLSVPLTCPVTPAYLHDAAVSGPGRGAAFHVVSDTPITAYDILPYGGASSVLPSASLLFPTTAWGTNYYAVAPHADGGGQLWMMLVGSADDTQVTLLPQQTLPGGSLGDAPAGQPTTVTVNAGEIVQWIGADPSSTVLQATQPIGVFTGSTYLKVATATSPYGGGEDATHQQIPHIQALGHEYVAQGIPSRLASGAAESIPYRFIGVVDDTVLTYEPSAPPGAPPTLGPGTVVELQTDQLFVVRAQDDKHPFGVTHYMPGAMVASAQGCDPATAATKGPCFLGDEDWVNLLPPRQYLQRYVFFTDPTYATTNLVVTRVKSAKGFAEVTVDCLAAPVSGWHDVGTSGDFQVAYVDLVRSAVALGQCGGSRHEAKSAGPFGLTVWGTDWFASYGYPAGGNVGPINEVTVTPVAQ
jgi:hypothetical protein